MNENSINGYLAVAIWSGLKSLLCVWKHVLGHTMSKTQYKRKSGIFSDLIFYTMYYVYIDLIQTYRYVALTLPTHPG